MITSGAGATAGCGVYGVHTSAARRPGRRTAVAGGGVRLKIRCLCCARGVPFRRWRRRDGDDGCIVLGAALRCLVPGWGSGDRQFPGFRRVRRAGSRLSRTSERAAAKQVAAQVAAQVGHSHPETRDSRRGDDDETHGGRRLPAANRRRLTGRRRLRARRRRPRPTAIGRPTALPDAFCSTLKHGAPAHSLARRNGQRIVDVLHADRHRRISAERRDARQHLVRHDAEAVDVAARSIGAPSACSGDM